MYPLKEKEYLTSTQVLIPTQRSFVLILGKKELVEEAVGPRYTVEFGVLAHQMTDQLCWHQNVRLYYDSDVTRT